MLLNTNAQAKHKTFDYPFLHWNTFEAKGSENHYKFQSNLRKDKDVLKEIKNTKKTGLISYLLFEDDKIVIDESDIPDKTRQGDTNNKWSITITLNGQKFSFLCNRSRNLRRIY